MAVALPEQPNKKQLMMIVLPALYGFILLIYTLFITLCICRRHKRKNNKVQPEIQSSVSSQQNNPGENIKVESIEDSKIQSESTVTTRNRKKHEEPSNKDNVKDRKRRTPLVVQQVRESENSYEEFRNIQQLRSPSAGGKQQKEQSVQNTNSLSQEYLASDTKRKMNEKSQRQRITRKSKYHREKRPTKNLIYEQYEQ